MITGKQNPSNPYLTVDAVVEKQDGIVLIRRKNPPVGWALPGGYVEYGETVEAAVEREVAEETGLIFEQYEQWRVFSDPQRDPRKHVVTVCFVGRGRGELKAGTDAVETGLWKPSDSLPELVFDHKKILREYLYEFSGGDIDG